MTLSYNDVRLHVNSDGVDSRVETNQRALIDKILARYATAGAVYRELIQNSNDAEAQKAEIYFTTAENSNSNNNVTQVLYRNNGMPFRPQDWSRLKKIAEGNPDESKVGAFGVGAYSMFSICEEPLVISGNEALAFFWKGDALWCKVAKQPRNDTTWTSFVLPSRDPYELPDIVEFGQFLSAALTFTQCLESIRVYVNNVERLSIVKETIQKPAIVEAPKSTLWWKNDGATTSTPHFSLQNKSIFASRQRISVTVDGKDKAQIGARYVSGWAKTKITADMSKRMERVTKKKPPGQVLVQLLVGAEDDDESNASSSKSAASQIVASFLPQMGQGRVFIGFRTSQTTGLGAHLAAPLIPTVEREAIDLQDPTLRVYNTELLEFAGIIMRLTLEHGMSQIHNMWIENAVEREAMEAKLLKQLEAEQQNEAKSESVKSEKKNNQVRRQEADTSSSSSSIMTFARFMAKGVKKQIVNVMNTVDSLIDDDSSLLNPKDPLPLTSEERQAIVLQRSFCPAQSTPDVGVGTALAQGFMMCLPNTAPPVLTKSGVVRGDQARLPFRGIEGFVKEGVVRKVVYTNAQEYHRVLGQCRPLNVDDLVIYLSQQILPQEEDVVRLIQWWSACVRVEPQFASRGGALKEKIRYLPKIVSNGKASDIVKVQSLDVLLYYVDDKKIPKGLPLPETCLPPRLQEAIGSRTLTSTDWFMALPMDVWAGFIASHACLSAGQPEDEKLRLEVLGTLCKEYTRRSSADKVMFGSLVLGLLQTKRCIPFDSSEPSRYAAECPSELYLNSSEIKAFDSVGSFNKVSQSVEGAGVTEEFLLMLGVRKSVAIDFLFTNLDTLRWSDDPKPLIEYLRSASLTSSDLAKLRSTQYLPAENDVSRTFAPAEVYLPNADLRIFPFLRLLQWPAEDELTERSANGKFLKKLGIKTHPPLISLLKHVSSDQVEDDQVRARSLDYIVKNLGPKGVYEAEYSRMPLSTLKAFQFLPCRIKHVLVPASEKRELQSPPLCYSHGACSAMGFPVLDPVFDRKGGNLYSTRFRCPEEPPSNVLISRLLELVDTAKKTLSKPGGEAKADVIVSAFEKIFQYLSSRSNEFDRGKINALKNKAFIPCKVNDAVQWYGPTDIYFKSSDGDALTEELFHVIEFSPFLAASGVKSEPTTHDLFRIMLASPDKVLKLLGEEKYRALLRRVAANPPFKSVSATIRNTPFLLAYKIKEAEDGGEEKQSYLLARAAEIFIIDNSFFGRMFPVIRAPHESDLEDFYVQLGSSYISKKVVKSFEVIGQQRAGTPLAKQLAERIHERRPLLVSPSVTSRPLVKDASAILDEKRLSILEANNLKAVYSLDKSVRNQRTTCCAKDRGGKKKALYVTDDFDWFDVGYAIGSLILQRCQLEDAFFIGSLLEAPVEQLRARGFPVDRILSPPEPEPMPAPVPVAASPAAPTIAKVPPAQAAPTGSGTRSGSQPESQQEAFEDIMQQMFPDCQEDFIKSKLGKNPSMDKVRGLAEEMSTGAYPKKKGEPPKALDTTATPKKPAKSPTGSDSNKSKRLGKRLGKAFKSGLRGSAGTMAGMAGSGGTSSNVRNGPGGMSPQHRHDHTTPVAPEVDKVGQANMENMLKNTVDHSTKVNAKGISSPETIMTSLPEGLSRDSNGCEVISGHSLKPFSGPYRTGKTHQGIRVFSARAHASSEIFLQEHFHAVDTFADVLQNLCNVYDLKLGSIAIFHDPTGGTIAFNANRALHFNVRFFHALHYSQNMQSSRACYSYWFTTMAHELAHHLVSAHNKEHGFYTESYVTLYLPKLVSMLSTQLEVTGNGTSSSSRGHTNNGVKASTFTK